MGWSISANGPKLLRDPVALVVLAVALALSAAIAIWGPSTG